MEFLIAAALVVLVPMGDKLIKIAHDRMHAKGEAEVVRAYAVADLARAHGEAEIIRARSTVPPAGLGRRTTAGEKDRERA
ncbi:hypothetical protein [Streptomyces narbonensis]|uniref:hypothetical protein n=1 Tax=Streptomyces narbonensis TaxID=67333 RepID=UPI003400F307